jgi:hypothetical protein
MSLEERIAQLEAENAVLREQISQLLRYVAENVVLREQVSSWKGERPNWKGNWRKKAITAANRPRVMGWCASPIVNANPVGKRAEGNVVMPCFTLSLRSLLETLSTSLGRSK